MRHYLIFLFILLSAADVSAQRAVVSFDQLKHLSKQEPRPVFVLLGTSWCKYCAAMKNSILRSEAGKETSYIVFFDGETKNDVEFAGRVFRSTASGTHELAKELGEINGQLAYPTIVILNERNEILYRKAGFHSAKAMERLLGEL